MRLWLRLGMRHRLRLSLWLWLRLWLRLGLRLGMRHGMPLGLRLGLRRFGARRLCDYLLEEIERTDFLLPRGGGIEVAVPRIPRAIAQFRKLKAFRNYKKALERAALSNAPTVAEGTE